MSALRLAMVTIVVIAGSAAADGKKLVVVVAKGSQVTNISRSDLKREFLAETVFGDDDTPLVPFNAAPGTPERIGFDRRVLGMSPDEVGRYWVDRKVRGEKGAPRSLPSLAHIAKVVAKFPHAIGYLPADQLTGDVQAVKVDGVSYTDARYPLTTD